MKVKTTYTDCDYITAGKEYEVGGSNEIGGNIIDDEEDSIFVLIGKNKCMHLNLEGTWEIIK